MKQIFTSIAPQSSTVLQSFEKAMEASDMEKWENGFVQD